MRRIHTVLRQQIVKHTARGDAVGTVFAIEHRREGPISRRNQIVLQAIEVVAMGVPEVPAIVVPVHRYQRHAMLHEPPCPA